MAAMTRAEAIAYQRGFFRGYTAGEQVTLGMLQQAWKGGNPGTPQQRLDHAWETDRQWHGSRSGKTRHPYKRRIKKP